ncbi:MAG TPA: geranylgeranyl reductase family protein [Acidimicrobiia bacterium]|nr:geranylgeranyl reductase family protein [Acidimicrobiia bacterium]
MDLIVSGAGPAGTAAAIAAARLGLEVVCFDKAAVGRDKTCGDGLTTQALRLLEQLGLTRRALAAAGYVSVHETVIVSPSGRRAVLPLPTDGEHAGVVPRAGLDAALVARAREGGVDVREQCAVDDVVVSSDGVKVRTETGDTLEARALVAADGHWSPVRRRLHPDAPRDLGTWHAARQYFDHVDDDRLWVIFERDLLPGYAWVFPLPGGGANVGYGVLRDQERAGRDLKALWPDLLARPLVREILGPRAVAREPVRAWPIPTHFDPARLADGRVLYAGDAAAVVDPLTGEGIAQALETGMLAADAIARGGAADELAARYRRSVQRSLGRDLRFASLLQRVLTTERGARAAIKAADLSPWTRRSFARWLFEGYPRALLLTPDRWHRGMFGASGAY